jgi:hypothetical protein
VRRDAGLARWRRLQAACAAARAALGAAVSGEAFEEAEALQAELDAAVGEAGLLQQQWGFSAEEQVVQVVQELQAAAGGGAAGEEAVGVPATAAEEEEEQEEGEQEEGEQEVAAEELPRPEDNE